MTNDEADQIREALLERFRNEGMLIRERIRMFLTFEGFLFASLAFTAANELPMLALIIAVIGGLACIPTYNSVTASFEAAQKLGEQYKTLTKDSEWPRLAGYDVGDSKGIFDLPEKFLPRFVGLAWVGIGLVVGYPVIADLMELICCKLE